MWKTEHRRVHMSVVMRFLLRTLVRSIATAIAGGRSKVERRGRMADERWRVALSEVEGPERDEMERGRLPKAPISMFVEVRNAGEDGVAYLRQEI